MEPDWDFFVSYAPGDVAWAEWVAWQLEERDYRVLVEAWDNVPGKYWFATLDQGVKHAARTIALVSTGYLRAGQHQLAWQAAVESDPDGGQRKLIPVKIEDCDVGGVLRLVTPIDLVGLEPDAARTRLLAQVKAVGAGRAKPPTDPSYPGIRQPAGPRPVAAPPFPNTLTGILAEVCDNLAREVERQWSAEAEHRRLHEQGMLPVRWSPADPELVKDWASLVHLASDGGAGWPTPAPETWASGPADLAGGPDDLADVLRRVPTGRLVVLGEPGAGKTTLLQRLTLDLLSHRREEGGGLVPVLFPLSSWDPNKRPFYDWLESKLLDYGAAHASSPGAGPSVARALLEDRLLLLLLDGFDEIPDASRGVALEKIRRTLRPGQRLVLGSRAQQYRDAVHPVRGADVLLTGAAGIELRPLGREDIAIYLRDASDGSRPARRWEPVMRALDESQPPPAARALTTPLALTLAKTIYTPRPGDAGGSRPDPAELLKQDRFPDRKAVEGYLLDGFVRAAYEPDSDPRQPDVWPVENVQRWLAFLASHLEHTQGGSPDFAWWHLPAAAPRRIRSWLALVGALIVWSVFMATMVVVSMLSQLVRGEVGVPEFVRWPGIAGPLGLLAWCAVMFYVGFSWLGGLRAWGTRPPAHTIRRPRHPRRVWVASGTGLAAAVFLAVPAWLDEASIRDGLGAWVVPLVAAVVGLVVGVTVGRLYGTTTADAAVGVTAGPGDTMATDRKAFRLLAVKYGLASALCLYLFVGALLYLRTEAHAGGVLGYPLLIAVLVGLPFALATGAAKTAWVPYAIVRRWLARRGDLPPNLTEFLADAYERRDVLRRVGAVYQFRHIELQRRLARHAEDPAAARLAADVEEELRGRSAGAPAFDLSWCVADSELTESWSDLQQLTASWALSSNGTRWAPRADDLAGTGTSLTATFEKIPTRRLVVLGQEGAGKSTLLARLALDLLTRRRPSDPVPVLLPLRSWNPDRQDFSVWLEHEVRRRHTWLGAFSAEVTGARALLDGWKIMPLLDGLEDLPPVCRTSALIAIDNWLRDGTPLVLSAEPGAFRAAVLPARGEPARLHGAAAVEILPVPLDVTEDFLVGQPPHDSAARRWASVLAEATNRPDSPVAGALRTPLAVSLARAVYRGRPGDPDADSADPGELCDRTRFPSPDTVQNRLMERHLQRAYLPRADSDEGFPTFESAKRALTHLAFHLETRLHANSIAWWEIQRTVPSALLAAPLMLAGAFYGIAMDGGALFTIVVFPAIYFTFGLFLDSDRNANMRVPVRYSNLRPPLSTPHMRNSAVRTRRTGPRAVLRRSRLCAFVVCPLSLAAMCVLASAFLSFVVYGGLPTSGRWWTAVVVGAVGCGLTGSFGLTAWGRFILAQGWLARRHHLPADLVAFLEDAQDRGVLRQTGYVWEFHHPALQRHLVEIRQGRDQIQPVPDE
jgi:hypothetical protein